MTKKQFKFYNIMYFLVTIGFFASIISSILLLLSPYIFFNNSNWFNKITISAFTFEVSNLQHSKLLFISLIIQSVVISLLLWNLRTFFKNLAADQIFVEANAKAIISSGFILGFMSFFMNVTPMLLAKKLIPYIYFSKGDISVLYHFNIELFVASIAVIVLGIVFKKAIHFVKENEFII